MKKRGKPKRKPAAKRKPALKKPDAKRKPGRKTSRAATSHTRRRAPARPARRPTALGLTVVKTLRAADLMTREPITVSQDMTVADLCDLFQERNINGAPVVDERGQLVGVVAQDDIIYGSMGRVVRDDGQGAAAAGAAGGSREAGAPGGSRAAGAAGPSRDESPARRRGRGMVKALRERSLRAVPEAPPRPGERAFWADQRAGDDPMRMPVRAIMTSPAISAEEKTPISDLCQVMWSLRIHRVPIVRGGKVTGLISSMDLCRAILNGQIKV
jgi:CBS domain-containing protein